MIPPRLVLDAGPLIALLHRSDPDHGEAVRGFHRLAEGGTRLFVPMPILFEVFQWLLYEAGPQAARQGLAKVVEGAVAVPFNLEDLEEARLLLTRLPGWEGTLEDASVALSPCGLGRPSGP
ncbi:MAG: type II toxin-antitoxin system VapC family toxin [Thermus sp.]|uniref:type II toxin-antitoxin system VapC family toxin n=1 Tax=Thermus sp. TaxID=275 RepID=UPI003D10F768